MRTWPKTDKKVTCLVEANAYLFNICFNLYREMLLVYRICQNLSPLNPGNMATNKGRCSRLTYKILNTLVMINNPANNFPYRENRVF